MNTIEKLATYRKSLERWKNHRRVYLLQVENGKPPKKPMEHEPLPQESEIAPDDAWALKIRAEVLKETPPMPTLDEILAQQQAAKKKSLPPKRKAV